MHAPPKGVVNTSLTKSCFFVYVSLLPSKAFSYLSCADHCSLTYLLLLGECLQMHASAAVPFTLQSRYYFLLLDAHAIS